MNEQQQYNYNRIAEAIAYIKSNFKTQPNLEAIAKQVHLSPYHFQKIFKDWAGVSPKKFLQFLSLEYAKSLLKDRQVTLFDAAQETGLSGTSRLHDLFVNIEGMTPGEFKNGAKNLTLNYSYAQSPFGNVLIASTQKGICYMSFADQKEKALSDFRQMFPNAHAQQVLDHHQQNALYIFNKDWSRLDQIKLHLKGTPFQLKVWEALLKIPSGSLATYGKIAQSINKPKASRAVGTAIGSNPIAYLIPCHRVIRASGEFGNYMWGADRKTAIIGWEAALLTR